MERNEKFRHLYKYAQSLGLHVPEIIEFFEKVEEGLILNDNAPEPGMFCYSDKTFSKELIDGKIVSGIVGLVKEQKAMVISLQEKKCLWSTGYAFFTEGVIIDDGEEATHLIFEKAKARDLHVDALQWCLSFSENGIAKGEAFLPSLQEWEDIYSSMEEINQALGLLGLSKLSGGYWASSEASNKSAWYWQMKDGTSNFCLKCKSKKVRPVFWVEL